MHNEELHNLYTSVHIIKVMKSRRIRWAGHIAHMVEMRYACYNLVGKPEMKKPLGRPRNRCEDNIRLDLKETG